jgi:hypothetical protein
MSGRLKQVSEADAVARRASYMAAVSRNRPNVSYYPKTHSADQLGSVCLGGLHGYRAFSRRVVAFDRMIFGKSPRHP